MTRHTLLLTIIVISCIGCKQALAQDETDALRYSVLNPQGTARSMGFGSALGAIGGDFTALSVNPAGIGVYRNSELSFTPALRLNSSSSTYTGASTADNNTRFTINNLGVVFTNAATGQRYKRSKWKSASFGIGINRLADFNGNYTYSGPNTTSSASEVFVTDAINYPGDIENPATLAGLGWQSYLVNTDTAGNFYQLPNFETGLNQTRSVEQKGGISEFAFSFGGNYEEKLFLGATIGIPSIRYIRDVTYREEDASGNLNNDFDYFEYQESLKTTGTGINLKLGFIYNFTHNFRAGASFHTPTFYGLTDNQTRYVISNTENFKSNIGEVGGPVTRVDAPVNEYQYSLITPWRGVVSAAGIIGKHGFISFDYEYVNYSSARFNFDEFDSYYQNEVNNGIKNMYKGASNVRIGGEARFDMFMLRLGFGYYGNPYRNTASGSDRLVYAAGFGFRFDNVFIDLGFNQTTTQAKEQPYVLVYPAPLGVIDVPTATVKNNFSNIALTAGLKF